MTWASALSFLDGKIRGIQEPSFFYLFIFISLILCIIIICSMWGRRCPCKELAKNDLFCRFENCFSFFAFFLVSFRVLCVGLFFFSELWRSALFKVFQIWMKKKNYVTDQKINWCQYRTPNNKTIFCADRVSNKIFFSLSNYRRTQKVLFVTCDHAPFQSSLRQSRHGHGV